MLPGNSAPGTGAPAGPAAAGAGPRGAWPSVNHPDWMCSVRVMSVLCGLLMAIEPLNRLGRGTKASYRHERNAFIENSPT